MTVFSKSEWIWLAEGASADQYAEFTDTVAGIGKNAIFRISCDSDYVLFINGKYVASGQYGDFEHYKIYDELDISAFLLSGNNEIRIIVHHFGTASSRYRPAPAGLIYEATVDGRTVAASSPKTLSRKEPCYESGLCRCVSVQLGFTFAYDATRATDGGFAPSVTVDKKCSFFPRPIKKSAVLPRKDARIVSNEGSRHFIVDLGGETVGLPVLELVSDTEQTVTVAWGEHVVDGGVRRTIDKRSFYYEYKTVKGKNCFTEYMLRIGFRYLEIFADEPIELVYAGALPQVYEVEPIAYSCESELDRRIYEICLNTLRLCMMEHYVDCPWREQALYALDSRNQMLCGYHAFKDGNREYARSNLKLISEDRRDDGLLSICYPCGSGRAIPSFSLHYIIAVEEYLKYTNDASLVKEAIPKMRGIIDEFISNSDGLIMTFAGERMWNFYDWSPYLDGQIHLPGVRRADLIVNCLFILAADSLRRICGALGEEYPYGNLCDLLRERARKEFRDECGLLTVHKGKGEYTVLGAALAILADVAEGDEARALCEAIVKGDLLTDCSLSLKAFKYDALLKTDRERYAPVILEEIRSSYKKMLDFGSDTVWETEEGNTAFLLAGSLCHGWSAIPIYYYRILGIAK